MSSPISAAMSSPISAAMSSPMSAAMSSPMSAAMSSPMSPPVSCAATFAALPARNLGQRELADLVANLAARQDIWADQVSYAGGLRHYASIHRDEHIDVWLICWSRGNDTGWHDHDVSAGAVRVVRGTLQESNLRIGGAPVRRLVGEGTTISFGPDHIHRLAGAAEQSVSLHVYSPPLWRLGQYVIDEDGLMRRVSVCYADELRPLDSLPAAQVA